MRLFFLFLSSFFFNCALSQNLLVNGGFEDENICSEFHVNCAPEGWISTADTYNNFFKIPGLAHRGQHCVAVEAGHSKKPFNRTFIRTQLLCGLRKGNKYRLEFYAKSKHNILDSVGIFFTTYDFLFEKQLPWKITPSMYVADATVKPSKGDTSWQKISMLYTATGREVYLTFGNFSKRDISGPTGIPREDHFFIFFDDVSLTPEDTQEKICNDWQKTRDEIYAFNARHQFLDLYVKTYTKRPPDPPVIEKTSVRVVDTLVIPDILFETDKSSLSKNSFRLMDSLCHSLLGKQIDSVVIEGHTDSTGTPDHNAKLSNDRAASVANYIIKNISLRQPLIITRGWASEKPVADNRTPTGRQLNRRVELFIYIRQ